MLDEQVSYYQDNLYLLTTSSKKGVKWHMLNCLKCFHRGFAVGNSTQFITKIACYNHHHPYHRKRDLQGRLVP